MKSKFLRLKRVAFALLILLLSVTGVKTTNAQSTVGTDFWVTFLPNHDGSGVNLSLIAAGSTPCSGTITNPYTNWSTSFEVSVGATTIIDIPLSEAYSHDESDCVINTGLHVVTTDSISLFASNFKAYTFDVTDVLPTYSLGSNYIIQTYNESNRGITTGPSSNMDSRSDASCSEFTVLAVEDNTTVYITLTDNSLNGHYANQPFSVTLNAGQCYQMRSANGGDFSGSQLSVSGNKRVAVFAGNLCTNVLYGCGYCDHIVEQMMPVSCWGNHFVVTNSSMRSFDVVRLTSENNGCQIFINGSYVTTINQKQTYQFEITSDDPSMYLETSEPAMVYLYYVGSDCAGENGDPSMVMISPIEQRMNYVTFSTFNSGASQYHFVNVITDTEDVSSVQLDGNSIASEFQTVSGNSGYSFARVQIEHGSHTLFTTGGGFVAHVYGLGDDESYAYSVGSNAVQELYTNMLVNGQTASDNMDVCGETVNFDLNYNYNVSQVNWTFGDGQTGSGIPFTHEYANLGDYTVSCDVYKLDSYGQDSLVATLNTVLHIYESYYTEFSATAHNSYYWEWMGETYTQSGDYSDNGQTIHGCDSIVTLHLTITHEITTTANPTEGGIVTGGGTFNQGQTCTLTATANSGYNFMCWTNMAGMVVSLDPEYSFTVTEDMTFTACFAEEGYCGVKFDLYDSYGDGWNGNCLVVNYGDEFNQLTFSSGHSATYILPLADGSHVTLGWISGSYIGECSFVISYLNDNEIYSNTGSNMNNSAFEFDMDCMNMPETPYVYIDVEANPYGGGSVSGGGTYRQGETCTLTATASNGYTFVNWTKNGESISTEAIFSFVVTEEANYIANFSPVSYEITATANPTEGGTITGGGTFNYGETCTLIAAPNAGYSFCSWMENDIVIAYGSTYTFTVENSRNLVANFGDCSYVVIGDGGTTVNSYLPTYEFYNYSLTQQIYTAEEIGTAGTINSIAFHTNRSTTRTLQIYLLHTNMTTFSSVNDWIIPTDGDLVYSGSVTYIPDDWTSITFDTPFSYDGTSNIALIVDDNTGSYVSSVSKRVFTSGDNCSIRIYSDGTNYDPYNPSNYNGTLLSVKNQIILGMESASSSYVISAAASPTEGGTVTGAGTYPEGSLCTLTATANSGYSFVNWTKNGVTVSTNAIYNFTVTENASYVANFTLSQGITQVTNFAQGYNWWSTYIEQNNIDGLSMLQNGLGSNGISILSQVDGYSEYYESYGWYGSLEGINNESSYKVLANEPCSVTMSGNLAVSSQHPITLNQGWTWMGYVSSTVLDVNTAMSGMIPTYGDKVKSHQYFAEYYPDYGWFGSLNTIVPGTGLMYYSANSQPVTFTYPMEAKSGELQANLSPENNHWVPNAFAYPDNMTVMAVIDLDDEELKSENFELSAFANDECRGSVKLTFVEPLNRYVAFLTIAGKDAAELNFGLYDTETGVEYYEADESLGFMANAIVGDANDLYVIHFRGTTGVDEFANRMQVYPNPVACGERFSIVVNTESKTPVRVEIVNDLGVAVSVETSTQSPISVVAPTTAGIYTIKIFTEDKGMQCRKLIVK